jgi:membrane associated rhomboid family serine protease
MAAPPASEPGSQIHLPDIAIRARSERQAMDWSVALLSQGIESTPIAEPEGWQLLVSQEHYVHARSVLDLYQRENRRWLWRPSPRSPALLFHWGALGWGALILFIDAWSRSAGSAIRDAGMMNGAAVFQGEWWRLFTAITLHADLAHLMANVTTGVILLGLAMARWSAGTALLAAWCAGALGNIAGLFLHPANIHGLGASGMVMGALGLLATASWQDRHTEPAAPGLLVRGLFGAILLFILIGVNPSSDVIAHLGGFVGGLILGALLGLLPRHALGHPLASLLAGAVAAASLVWTWSLALLHR